LGGEQKRVVVGALLGSVALAALAYWRALALPLISDDYLQIFLARSYGPPEAWRDLFADPLYRCRATSLWLSFALDRFFGVQAFALNLAGLALHILNSIVVLAFGAWRRIGWRLAAAGSLFFAVYEGHQEAVIWYAALPELLVFFFGCLSVLAWALWVQGGLSRPWLPVIALLCFALALLSKESAVVVPALMAVIARVERIRFRHWLALAPFAALSVCYTLVNFATRDQNPHYSDGTFSLMAPFPLTLAHSVLRMLWFWGILALLVLLWRHREAVWMALAVCVWMALTLLPYSFLTYMTRVPSRHTYWASAGLAVLVGAAFLRVAARPRIAVAVGLVLIAHNTGYLWTRKQRQFLERAEPTQALLRHVETNKGPVLVECFPYHRDIALLALEMTGMRTRPAIFFESAAAPPEASRFCFGAPLKPPMRLSDSEPASRPTP
jgi:hypothetical protein